MDARGMEWLLFRLECSGGGGGGTDIFHWDDLNATVNVVQVR